MSSKYRAVDQQVLDFFVAEGWVDCAESMVQETPLLKPSSTAAMNSLAERAEMLQCVRRGAIEGGLTVLTSSVPAVLSRDPGLAFDARKHVALEKVRQGDTIGALQYATDSIAPVVEQDPSTYLDHFETLMETIVDGGMDGEASSPHGWLALEQRDVLARRLNEAWLLQLQDDGAGPIDTDPLHFIDKAVSYCRSLRSADSPR